MTGAVVSSTSERVAARTGALRAYGAPLLLGMAASVGLEQIGEPLAAASSVGILGALILGLIDRALRWRNDMRSSAERLAETLATERRESREWAERLLESVFQERARMDADKREMRDDQRVFYMGLMEHVVKAPQAASAILEAYKAAAHQKAVVNDPQ